MPSNGSPRLGSKPPNRREGPAAEDPFWCVVGDSPWCREVGIRGASPWCPCLYMGMRTQAERLRCG